MEEKAIADYGSYCDGMKKSLEDKMFFEDWLNDGIEHLVDFGCADGTLLAELHRRYPNMKLTGIDMDQKMLDKIPIDCEKVCRNLPVPYEGVRANTAALNLSSVLHEVYSYGSEDYISGFWHNINHAKRYKYVFIRDMMYDEPYRSKDDDDRWKRDIQQRQQWCRNIINLGDSSQIHDFEYYQGSLAGHSKANQVHFLLKYRYTKNWEREVKENYLSVDKDEVFCQLSNYDCVYFNQYALPFLHDRIKKDFDIDFNEMTHVKMVFKLREDT